MRSLCRRSGGRMPKSVSFNVTPVAIPENSEGAARLISNISDPRKPTVVMKKLRDFHLLLEGERPLNNRSKGQVLDSVSVVWAQVRRAIEVGDWFDRMFLNHTKSAIADDARASEYARTLANSLGGRDKQILWKPYLPVAHMAAGFRLAMMKTDRARYFDSPTIPRATQVAEIRDLLFDDHGWMDVAAEAAEARLVLPRLAGLKIPGKTRLFVMTSRLSQKSPPNSQD